MSHSCNNPKTIADLRDMIREKASETTLADSQYDYGHLNGWLGALYWAGEIDREVCDTLKNEAKAAMERAVFDLHALAADA
ncbi:hypothetical protein D3C81_1443060 [compost metagenome]